MIKVITDAEGEVTKVVDVTPDGTSTDVEFEVEEAQETAAQEATEDVAASTPATDAAEVPAGGTDDDKGTEE